VECGCIRPGTRQGGGIFSFWNALQATAYSDKLMMIHIFER
jgi:hypothetical protein